MINYNLLPARTGVITFLLALIGLSSNISGSVADIERLGLFGCKKDSISAEFKYNFELMPNIAMYDWKEFASFPFFYNYHFHPPANFDPVLFNKEDSSLYYFGDKIKNFSRVLRPYLNGILTRGKSYDAIRLYLLSSDNKNNSKYYFVESASQLAAYWDTLSYCSIKGIGKSIDDQPIEWPDSLKYIEIEYINNLEYPIRISDSTLIQEVEIITWEQNSGKLVKWKFKITPEKFTQKYGYVLASRIGPCSGRIMRTKSSLPELKNTGKYTPLLFDLGFSANTLTKYMRRSTKTPDNINPLFMAYYAAAYGGMKTKRGDLLARLELETWAGSENEDSRKIRGGITIIYAPLNAGNARITLKPLFEAQYSKYYFAFDSIVSWSRTTDRLNARIGAESFIYIKYNPYLSDKDNAFDRVALHLLYERSFLGITTERFSITLALAAKSYLFGMGFRNESFNKLCNSQFITMSLMKP